MYIIVTITYHNAATIVVTIENASTICTNIDTAPDSLVTGDNLRKNVIQLNEKLDDINLRALTLAD